MSLFANVVSLSGTAVGLLHVLKCNCKTNCHSVKCSCRKQGLICTVGCGKCRGDSWMNSLIKMGSDDAVNMNDECRKQRLKLENITCICLKCICFFIGQPIAVIAFKLCVLANNKSPIFNIKAMAGNVTFRDHQYSIPACSVMTSDQQ